MKIIFLNTWHGKIKHQLEAFIESQKNDTDIFCFQEADSDAAEILQHALTSFNSLRIDKYVAERVRYSQAIYTNKKMDIKSNGSVLKDNVNYGLDQYVQFTLNGDSFWLSNVHGTPVPREKHDSAARLEQSKLLIDFYKDKPGAKIIGGDFNLFPDSQSVMMFESNGFDNLISQNKIKTTRNHLAWDRWPTKHYFSDYVFTTGVEIKDFKVLNDEVSDHLPMILEV